jgi:hypothetical protein
MSGRANVFSLVGAIAYCFAYYLNISLFQYYPQSRAFSLHPLANAGFAMFWYGWIAFAVVAGLVAIAILPRRWLERVPQDLSWIALVLAIFATLIYEQRWFF